MARNRPASESLRRQRNQQTIPVEPSTTGHPPLRCRERIGNKSKFALRNAFGQIKRRRRRCGRQPGETMNAATAAAERRAQAIRCEGRTQASTSL
jgi:hypothetical protein